jgi:hypothetical protein
MVRVYLAEGLHRELEDQLEVRHPAAGRLALQSGYKSLAGSHRGIAAQ